MHGTAAGDGFWVRTPQRRPVALMDGNRADLRLCHDVGSSKNSGLTWNVWNPHTKIRGVDPGYDPPCSG